MKTFFPLTILTALAMAGPAPADDQGGRGYGRSGQSDRGYSNHNSNRGGYDRDNRGRAGFNGAGYGRGGYDRGGYNRGGYGRAGFDQGYRGQRYIQGGRGYGPRGGGFYRQRGFYAGPPVVYGGYYAPVAVGGFYGGPGFGGPGFGGGRFGGGYYDPCRPTGAGAVVGAVTGGLIGSGLSRRGDGGLGTILGVGIGALAGNAIEANGRCY